jgi:Protein of unknown function (DUF1549)/Protein of unknown function (DUF1553)
MTIRGCLWSMESTLAWACFLLFAGSGWSQEAKEEKHWAFQPVTRPAVPSVSDRSWVRTPIDAFILSRLEKVRLKPAPPADRRTLLRRVYLDLIGLPPNPDEQIRFLNDSSPTAFERVVDDLLSRPQYGERWARHWLDTVRYAESNGYERDGAKPNAWRYRDYVIDSLNRDKPYDRFLTEQIAGDEIPGSNAETQIATTFMRLGTWDDEPADPKIDRYDQLDDVLGTTATAFLGVTLRCARCHDHKFEPFMQEDYYRLLAVFEPLKRPQNDRQELDRFVGPRQELAAYEAALAKPQAEITALEKKIKDLRDTVRERVLKSAEDSLAKSGKRFSLPTNVVAAFRTDPAKRTQEQKGLVRPFSKQLEQEIDQAPTPEEKARQEQWEGQIASLKKSLPKEPPRAYIWYEEGPKAPTTKIFRRGDPTRPKGEAAPGLPAVLVDRQPAVPEPLEKSTGRRLWLARWMTLPENPLIARVIVNRIWQHHFGEGLVASANDFGVMGQKPVDQNLLDWLAAEFVAGEWRMKRLHRMIVLSSAYQMASLRPVDGKNVIPGVDAKVADLGHWRQRRLEAEAVRDSILAVSGRLNPQMSGPSIFPPIPRAVLEGQSRPGDGWGKSTENQASRRSIYIFVKRVLAVPELELLDTPDTTFSCEQRPVSTTGPQALTFLNGEFIQQQARYFAERLVHEAGPDSAAQIKRAFELALCRPPRPEELAASLDFLSRQQRQIEAEGSASKKGSEEARQKALAAFCLVILNTNEFVFWN